LRPLSGAGRARPIPLLRAWV